MGFDIKDIADILPFILDNLPVCAYIIIISIVFGFLIGKQFEKNKQEKKIIELKSQLESEKEVVVKIRKEKEQLDKKVDDANKECEILKSGVKNINSGLGNSQLASLSELGRMLDSTEGKIELTALIELNYKRGQEKQTNAN